MKSFDMRFDENVFKNFIGQTFHKYRCDPLVYTSSVTQIVGLYIGDEVYKMSNVQEPTDYYGNMDDIAIYRFTKVREEDIRLAVGKSGSFFVLLILLPKSGKSRIRQCRVLHRPCTHQVALFVITFAAGRPTVLTVG